MSAHKVVAGSQRRHWYPYAIEPAPVQPPVDAVSVAPARASPDTAGSAVLAGGGGSTSSVGWEDAVPEPTAVEAVTATRSLVPTSALPATYVVEVAPASSEQ